MNRPEACGLTEREQREWRLLAAELGAEMARDAVDAQAAREARRRRRLRAAGYMFLAALAGALIVAGGVLINAVLAIGAVTP